LAASMPRGCSAIHGQSASKVEQVSGGHASRRAFQLHVPNADQLPKRSGPRCPAFMISARGRSSRRRTTARTTAQSAPSLFASVKRKIRTSEDIPVKSFNNMTERASVGSFNNMTERASGFPPLLICESPPGSRPRGGPRPRRPRGWLRRMHRHPTLWWRRRSRHQRVLPVKVLTLTEPFLW
jgi:hypothetical protein